MQEGEHTVRAIIESACGLVNVLVPSRPPRKFSTTCTRCGRATASKLVSIIW